MMPMMKKCKLGALIRYSFLLSIYVALMNVY